jgi:hypothetical protein
MKAARDEDTSLEQNVASIQDAYLRLGHTLGWRFLTGPKVTLSGVANIAFITLNPGGSSEPVDHPQASCENGNAYLTETWPGSAPGAAPLQRQVQMLFTQLKSKRHDNRSLAEFMDTEVMSAYFIPFRSPSIAALPFRKESLRFARSLWGGIFASWLPRLVITIDNQSFEAIVGIFSTRPHLRVTDRRRFPTGWGAYEADAIRLSGLGDDGAVTIVRLPHLSRFQLFGNPARAPQLGALLDYLSQALA